MLIANTTQDVGYGYSIFIRDQNRNRVATCNSGSNCSFFFQPPQDSIRYFDAVVQRRTEPSDQPASDWKVVTRGLDDDELMSSSDIDVMAAQLIAASGSELAACLALGEAVRTHAAGSSVPDVTLVCTSKGLAAAIRFAGKLNRAGNVFKVVNSIGAAIHAPNPASPQPDCDQVGFDGACLDEGTGPSNEPPPTPDPAGGGIRPPANCMDTASAQDLIDSMPIQGHHVATKYQPWLGFFQGIADRYGLDVLDSAGAWNLVPMPHRGPHPAEYPRDSGQS
jgi:hypothetical protein